MLATCCHPQRQVLWLKQQRSCWVGQPVEPRSNKHRQLRQYQQPCYKLQTNAQPHIPDHDVQPAQAIVSGAPLHTNTVAAIVTGTLIVGTVSPLKALCLDMLGYFHTWPCCCIYSIEPSGMTNPGSAVTTPCKKQQYTVKAVSSMLCAIITAVFQTECSL